METQNTPIRVLIVEDSLVARELLVSILQNAPGFQVIGTAQNGIEAVRLTKRLQPDVIAMDVYMPEMDGLEATRQIMAETPRPIVMVSASFNKNENKLSFDALQAGALTILEKPSIDDPPEMHELLINQLRLMAEVKVVRRWGRSRPTSLLTRPPGARQNGKSKIHLLTIASSTGGPGVLAKILGNLPADFPVPILIVQHIMAGFSEGLAAWLNQLAPAEVRLAQQGDQPKPGQALIAPDNRHMLVNEKGLILLSQAAPQNGLRPAANFLFNSAAQVYGGGAIGVVLTGMGNDGAEGLLALRRAGAHTIAQDEASCVVFGMPAVAIELGAAEQVLPADKIAAALMALV
ncbi:MAG: chemotaxis-specific protein-glutamate methyltransferase CheB [Anaerolineae bacterium]|nr:chemotaxis-specific protein-glutamate methyltransferase CheB [Anaerolineae bacterium]